MGHAYTGRFAPSPTGPLHAGSLVAALASWLDARAHNGLWRVRLEDVDAPRCLPGMGDIILRQLAQLGLLPDGEVMVQSARSNAYQEALSGLIARGLAYPCHCSRQQIEAALAVADTARPRHGERVYPGSCRPGALALPKLAPNRNAPGTAYATPGHSRATAASWRLRTDFSLPNWHLAPVDIQQFAIINISSDIHWPDRRLGPQTQSVATAVGDFVLLRADGWFTYQLAVVVDDAAQGITHIVRGEDLADNTARQIWLQRALGLPTPHYLHTPLVRGADGQKLSKQNGAQPLDTTQALAALNAAAQVLGLAAHGPRGASDDASGDSPSNSPHDALAAWVRQWRHLYN